MKYTIKSTSEEGVHYLVNGWHKRKKFWIEATAAERNTLYAKEFFFDSSASAKASLTKLLKVMPEYAYAAFEIAVFN